MPAVNTKLVNKQNDMHYLSAERRVFFVAAAAVSWTDCWLVVYEEVWKAWFYVLIWTKCLIFILINYFFNFLCEMMVLSGFFARRNNKCKSLYHELKLIRHKPTSQQHQFLFHVSDCSRRSRGKECYAKRNVSARIKSTKPHLCWQVILKIINNQFTLFNLKCFLSYYAFILYRWTVLAQTGNYPDTSSIEKSTLDFEGYLLLLSNGPHIPVLWSHDTCCLMLFRENIQHMWSIFRHI